MSSRFLGIVKFLQDCAATFEDGRGSTFSARPHPEGTRTLRIRTAKDVSIPVSSSGTAAKLTTEDWSAKISTSIERRQHWQASMPPRWPPHPRRNLRDSDTGCPGSRCHSGGRSGRLGNAWIRSRRGARICGDLRGNRGSTCGGNEERRK